MPTFFGIDLAWSDRNRTGLAVIHWQPDRRGLRLEETALAQSDEEIVDWVRTREGKGTVLLAIDAPIIAPNEAGTMRACDRHVTKDFGRFHAGTYPANRVRCARPIRLCERLKNEGFSPYPHIRSQQNCRRQLEIFPHPAQVVLFRRERIIKYKKGAPEDKRRGLAELLYNIQRHLPRETPPLLGSATLEALLDTQLDALRGRRMKGFEDQVDALLCAYMAGYYWFWGKERCRVYGDVASGYIICPRLTAETSTH